MPHGLSERRSLFIRYRHVEAVQFFGAGSNSRFSFKRGQSLLDEGLSLRLMQNRKTNWASGAIQFKKPIDTHLYNSVVVWVWPSEPNMRMWVGLKGARHARSGILPSRAFPPNEPSQLVIPFSRFTPKGRVDWNAIEQMYFEFGQQTTGNSPSGALQILGVAFVRQDPPLQQSRLVLGRASTRVVFAEPLDSLDPSDPEDLTPLSPPAALPAPRKETLLSGGIENIFEKMARELKGRPVADKSAMGKPGQKNYSRELIQSYSRGWPAQSVDRKESTGGRLPEIPTMAVFYLIFLSSFSVLWFFLLRRQKPAVTNVRMGKVFNEIHWPFAVTQPSLHRKVEREFWNGVADQGESFGWLSTTGIVVDKSSPLEYFGESFLRRQVETALRADIRLFPSLSLTNTMIRRDAFQPNLERSFAALRTLAIETLLRFSDVAAGARIENAAELFSTRLRRKPQENEFWKDVINTVRHKKPGFIFIADNVGDQTRAAREAGFDFYGNNLLLDTLLDQLRSGKVGDVRAFLRGESAQHLSRSIFDLSPLFRGSRPVETEYHQNILCALLATMLPGVVQHDNTLPADMTAFIQHMARTPAVRDGQFSLLTGANPSVLAFARWRKKSLLVAVANFSAEPQIDVVNLRPLLEGFDNNKLYLFDNALHGTTLLKNLLNQAPAEGPALAMWGQNLRDSGLPVSAPGIGLRLFSVALSRPVRSSGDAAPATAEPVATVN